MNFNEYQELAGRTANKHINEKLNYALGVTGEAGEIADLIKKSEFHGHEMNRGELAKEIGDVLWYLSQLASVYDLDLGRVAEKNIEKLKRRYPEGFSEEASVNRVG
ncbi:nucleoside triphosphate pyrophosphohydrolase family protein [Metabacillus sp. 84]|uniref:nucleoside triphosphate pyrophosphohydrolase family protein n=1 Tax=Metabacillus sp. 84 TaxID=3404705 RepID=UPI003CE8570C